MHAVWGKLIDAVLFLLRLSGSSTQFMELQGFRNPEI